MRTLFLLATAFTAVREVASATTTKSAGADNAPQITTKSAVAPRVLSLGSCSGGSFWNPEDGACETCYGALRECPTCDCGSDHYDAATTAACKAACLPSTTAAPTVPEPTVDLTESTPTAATASTIDCTGKYACTPPNHWMDGETRTCPDGKDCTLTCSGHRACRGMTINGPKDHKLNIICTGSGYGTCAQMMIHAEFSAGVSFLCDAAGAFCGYEARLFCPRCDQVLGKGASQLADSLGYYHPTGGCSAGPTTPTSSKAANGGAASVCAVTCTATSEASAPCGMANVYAGPGGAKAVCREDSTMIGISENTCWRLQVHEPHTTAVAAIAPVSLDCDACTGRYKPGTAAPTTFPTRRGGNWAQFFSEFLLPDGHRARRALMPCCVDAGVVPCCVPDGTPEEGHWGGGWLDNEAEEDYFYGNYPEGYRPDKYDSDYGTGSENSGGENGDYYQGDYASFYEKDSDGNSIPTAFPTKFPTTTNYDAGSENSGGENGENSDYQDADTFYIKDSFGNYIPTGFPTVFPTGKNYNAGSENADDYFDHPWHSDYGPFGETVTRFVEATIILHGYEPTHPAQIYIIEVLSEMLYFDDDEFHKSLITIARATANGVEVDIGLGPWEQFGDDALNVEVVFTVDDTCTYPLGDPPPWGPHPPMHAITGGDCHTTPEEATAALEYAVTDIKNNLIAKSVHVDSVEAGKVLYSATRAPTEPPSQKPTRRPTPFPTAFPSRFPSRFPTKFPVAQTKRPTSWPSRFPTTTYPTTKFPSSTTKYPTTRQTKRPTSWPSRFPTTAYPTTKFPSSARATKYPTGWPVSSSTKYPTSFPISSSKYPTRFPVSGQSRHPTAFPVARPTDRPTVEAVPPPTTATPSEALGCDLTYCVNACLPFAACLEDFLALPNCAETPTDCEARCGGCGADNAPPEASPGPGNAPVPPVIIVEDVCAVVERCLPIDRRLGDDDGGGTAHDGAIRALEGKAAALENKVKELEEGRQRDIQALEDKVKALEEALAALLPRPHAAAGLRGAGRS